MAHRLVLRLFKVKLDPSEALLSDLLHISLEGQYHKVMICPWKTSIFVDFHIRLKASFEHHMVHLLNISDKVTS